MKNKISLKLVVVMIVMLSLLVVSVSTALAWEEGFDPYWYIDASYGGYHNSVPLVIEFNGDSSDGQIFNVGDAITISSDIHAYAEICDYVGTIAFTRARVTVSGPSGFDSDFTSDVVSLDPPPECAVAETNETLTISYELTNVGLHNVAIYSQATVDHDYPVFHETDSAGTSLRFEVIEPVINVDIDIKPGSDPNCFNSDGHGVIPPVAILGSADFDAATVDPFTVQLDSAAVRVKGKSGNAGSLEDVNGDGYLDLVIQILDEGSYSSGDTIATLTGETFDGVPIEGSDSICIRPPE